MRRLLIIAGLLASACSGMRPAAPIQVAESCTMDDTAVQIEAGVSDEVTVPLTCEGLARMLSAYRAAYEERFGRQGLADRVVRIRRGPYLDDSGHTGYTYADAIDLTLVGLVGFPHELNHVRTGSGHAGWCVDFEPWSEAVLGVDQRAYLGCGK